MIPATHRRGAGVARQRRGPRGAAWGRWVIPVGCCALCAAIRACAPVFGHVCVNSGMCARLGSRFTHY